ncbi:LysR family transcriptional regulator [Bifidobacterium simiarum]|uniref:LysR family transcriptional regulator n=1 Tax=Bifidobacterium simiarum TaxID=2045441 RepID=UPI001BDBD889|nr:LysR family transcriptional regulator [Bifidobacterium simiarum]MBT1166852.1 LysR family transcriptional regulator [Bifidobacterium simiarum]
MEIRILRNFIVVVQEEGVTAAADVLRISQPALSRQIKELEHEVGASLFVRGNRSRSLELTDEGRLLYRRAREIVELADRTKSEIAAGERIEGDVHIAAAQSVVMRLVGRAATRLRECHPDIRIRLHDGFGADIVEWLNNGLADFGVLVQPTDMSRYDHLVLPGGDEVGVLMRDDDPLASHDAIRARDLQGVPLIMPQGALNRREYSGWFGRYGRNLNIVGTMNLSYNASRFVQEGYGCALGYGGIVDMSAGSGLCFRPLDPPLHGSLSMAWKKDQTLTPAAAAFLETLRDVVAREEDTEGRTDGTD